MSQYDCFASWGFKGSPFQSLPLHPTEQGARLFVGRDDELHQIKVRLHTPGKITCVEGPVGSGKTSLVNVAAYQCLTDHLKTKSGQLLIPSKGTALQLEQSESTESFVSRTFMHIARTLIDTANEIRSLNLSMDGHNAVKNWLNSPTASTVQLGISAYVGISKSTSTTSSPAFASGGLEHVVKHWLNEIFPYPQAGGVVCIIDNIELLANAKRARSVLEELRDRLFTTNGIRWVFCGANGIVSSILSSPRLGGYLIKPVLEVGSISASQLPGILERRRVEFSINTGKEYLPLVSKDFQDLYSFIHRNLRDVLDYSEAYCRDIFLSGNFPKSESEMTRRFESWLDRQTKQQYVSLLKSIPRDDWRVLDIVMSARFSGRFGPDDFSKIRAAYTWASLEHRRFVKIVEMLEGVGLVQKWQEDSGKAKDPYVRYEITSKGALVHFGRIQKEGIQADASPEIHQWLKRVSH